MDVWHGGYREKAKLFPTIDNEEKHAMDSNRIERGDSVKDRITGFEGIVTCKSVWLNGCVRFCVTSRNLDKDGKAQDMHFDEPQLLLLEKASVTPEPEWAPTPPVLDTTQMESAPRRVAAGGGDQPGAVRAADAPFISRTREERDGNDW
jgi:hypothetical protein